MEVAGSLLTESRQLARYWEHRVQQAAYERRQVDRRFQRLKTKNRLVEPESANQATGSVGQLDARGEAPPGSRISEDTLHGCVEKIMMIAGLPEFARRSTVQRIRQSFQPGGDNGIEGPRGDPKAFCATNA